MFYHELADPPVSSLHFRNLLPSLAETQNIVQIRGLLIHARGKGDYGKTLGGNSERI